MKIKQSDLFFYFFYGWFILISTLYFVGCDTSNTSQVSTQHNEVQIDGYIDQEQTSPFSTELDLYSSSAVDQYISSPDEDQGPVRETENETDIDLSGLLSAEWRINDQTTLSVSSTPFRMILQEETKEGRKWRE